MNREAFRFRYLRMWFWLVDRAQVNLLAEMARRLKEYLLCELGRLTELSKEEMLEARYRRLMSYGN